MKSRILAVLFAAMLAAGTLVGCGSKAAEDAETKTEDTKETEELRERKELLRQKRQLKRSLEKEI